MAVVEGDSPAEWGESILSAAIGAGSPVDQIVAALLLGGFIIMTTGIGLVGTLLLAPLAFGMAVIGVLRLWKPFEQRWPLS